MRILDRYLLTQFVRTFFSVFLIVLFIFIFQAIWLFIDELAGKDLDLEIIGKFLLYYMPTIIDDVLPLAVLVTSILTYGSFAEHYEFAAIKASGISFLRAMRSTLVFSILLGIAAFFVSNNLIPAAEQKIFNLRRNIAKVKPSAALVEGIFTDIEGTNMNMKVREKYGENDRYLRDVLIHQKAANQQNTVVISAKEGEFISSKESELLKLVLFNGYYYEDILLKKPEDIKKQPFARASFDTYIKFIDLSSLNEIDLEEESSITTDKMKPTRQLLRDIDSLEIDTKEQLIQYSESTMRRMAATFRLKERTEADDEVAYHEKWISQYFPVADRDSLFFKTYEKAELLSVLPTYQRSSAIRSATNQLDNLRIIASTKSTEMGKQFEFYNRHIISLHKKFALALSCILLFFVGAPIGALIRKGGLGLPMVIAIVLFLSYYFLGVFAENYAKRGNIHPIIGAWFSTFVMLPVSIYVTQMAVLDRGIKGGSLSFKYLWELLRKRR
ncbi:MAG: LptF/LptG family permease [Flavobacteriaceae bacterium]